MGYAAIASVFMIALYFVFAANVGRVRGKTGLKAPAVTGNADFERAYRVQMNTLEHMAVALPALWIYAVFGSATWAAVAGAVWVVGRIVYAFAYIRDPSRRGPGMLLTLAGELWLLGGAGWAAVALIR
jgi:glutathione S-transferase